MNIIFADTFYYLALLNRHDAAHEKAVLISNRPGDQLLTTEFVLFEVADALSNPIEKPKFLALVNKLRGNRSVNIVAASSDLLNRGIELYSRRPDKDWPLTDCISFVVMNEKGVIDALTGDVHFQQAGFHPLLSD